MTQEIFKNILLQKSYFDFALLFIAYTVGWFVTFQLGCKILGAKINFQKTLPAILILLANIFLIKSWMPPAIYGIEAVILLTILLGSTLKVSFFKSVSSAIIITLLNAMGDVLIAGPLAVNKSVAIFFFRTAVGNSVLALIEMFFPALTSILLSIFPFSIIPPFRERKMKKLDLVRVMAFGLSFYWVYRSLMKLLISLLENPRNIFSDLVSDWLAATSSVILYIYIYYQTNKEREEERLRINKLEVQNQKLTELTQQLQAMKLTPREVIETINCAIARLKKFQETNLNLLSQIQPLELPGAAPKTEQIYLSPREISVLKFVGQGKSNREIAEALNLKESYIKGTVSRLYDKLDIHDRGGLAVYAIKAGYTKLGPQ